MQPKKWYESKTLWSNAIAVAAIAAQSASGKEILDPAAQGVLLGLVNLALRLMTKNEVAW